MKGIVNLIIYLKNRDRIAVKVLVKGSCKIKNKP